MKLELTTGVTLSIGLLILFGAGYQAVDQVVRSSAESQLEDVVAAEAHATALGGKLAWQDFSRKYRGVTRSALSNPLIRAGQWSSESDELAQKSATNVLAALLDSVNSRGQAALLDAEGKVVSSTVATKAEEMLKFQDFQSVKDALNGADMLRAEEQSGQMYLVSSAPVSAGGVLLGALVITAPVDDRELSMWALKLRPETGLLIASTAGDNKATSLLNIPDARKTRVLKPGKVSLKNTDYWSHREAIIDDAGVAGHVIGLKAMSREKGWDFVGKVRNLVWLFGAISVLMTLLVSMFTPSSSAAQTTSLSPPVSGAQVGLPQSGSSVSREQQALQSSQPSISDDLPPLRLGQNDSDGSGPDSPQMGLAAEMAAAATQTASSVPPPAASELSSRPIEEIPTPENAGDVTIGKGASPRPDVINNMMNTPAKASKPKATPAPMPPLAPTPPPEPAAPLPSPEEEEEVSAAPRPVSAEPGAFGVNNISANDTPEDDFSAPPSIGSVDDFPATTDFPASQNVDGLGGDADLGFTPNFGGDSFGFAAADTASGEETESETGPSGLGLPAFDEASASAQTPDLPPLGGEASPQIPPMPPLDAWTAPDPAESSPVPQSETEPPPMSFTGVFGGPSANEANEQQDAPNDSAPAVENEPGPASLPPPPSLVSSPVGGISDGAATLLTSPASTPPLPPLPQAFPAAEESTQQLQTPPQPVVNEVTAFSNEHYQTVFDKFVSSKKGLGDNVDSITFDGFAAKLRKSEQKLIEQHGCKAVRFEVLVKENKVSLRPQLVR